MTQVEVTARLIALIVDEYGVLLASAENMQDVLDLDSLEIMAFTATIETEWPFMEGKLDDTPILYDGSVSDLAAFICANVPGAA